MARSKRPILAAVFGVLRDLKPVKPSKLEAEADALVENYGEEAIEMIRARLLKADRAARKELYRLHDELARRRRDHSEDPLAGLA